MPKVLILEDAKEYVLMYESALSLDFDLTFATTGKQALDILQEKRFDFVIVDVVLPDVSGLQVCSFIKSQEGLRDMPVMLVTSREDIEDKVHGFNSGADDYLTKPFHFKELRLRIRAKLKHIKDENRSSVFLPGFEIDIDRQRVRHHDSGVCLELTRIEFKLLVYFSARIDHVISRRQVLEAVWPDNLNISDRTVDSHLSNLRKKIEGFGVTIKAVHGVGYRVTVNPEVSSKAV